MITNEGRITEYYQALLDRNSQYVGIFYVGVKTTSIFCIATCRARKPKRENVVFYTSVKEALDDGFRPCKVCKPTEYAADVPEPISQAIQLVHQHPKEKISDERLRSLDISPEVVRRWFKKNYGLTFHAYQRMYRINQAFIELKEGKKATETAFASGYESLSGFGYTYKKLLGKAPVKSANQAVILLNRVPTPLGPMFVAATDQGICLLEFTDRKMLETEFGDLQKRLGAEVLLGENEHIRQLKQELKEYFAGDRTSFDVSLHTPGTDFQQAVWHTLTTIPYGTTTSYQAMAQQLANPKAVRAVGRANGMNRVAIVIPCHRVVGKNGALTGYAGGLERKKWLLEFEEKHAREEEA